MDITMKGWVFCVVLSGLCVSSNAVEEYQADAEPVDVVVYYTSLCQGCLNIFETQLLQAYRDVGAIMKLTLVPYGNSWETLNKNKERVFNCVRGENECLGNMIQTCAIHELMNETGALPFIFCMMRTTEVNKSREEAATQCTSDFTDEQWRKIQLCYRTSLGNRLQHEMGLKTQALNAPEFSIPWVTINGDQLPDLQIEAQTELVKMICKAYPGRKPDACPEDE